MSDEKKSGRIVFADSYNPKAKALPDLKRTPRTKANLTDDPKVKAAPADKAPNQPRRPSAKED
jgi:hypothetical protein